MAAAILLATLVVPCAACGRDAASPAADAGACLAQATAVYDSVPLARLVDGTVWVSADRMTFTEILGPTGHLHASDVAASGSTAYGSATGCAIVDGGNVWCFPLSGPLIDSTPLGGRGAGVTSMAAAEVVTSADGAAPPRARGRSPRA